MFNIGEQTMDVDGRLYIVLGIIKKPKDTRIVYEVRSDEGLAIRLDAFRLAPYNEKIAYALSNLAEQCQKSRKLSDELAQMRNNLFETTQREIS
jgi:hypothetical protein